MASEMEVINEGEKEKNWGEDEEENGDERRKS